MQATSDSHQIDKRSGNVCRRFSRMLAQPLLIIKEAMVISYLVLMHSHCILPSFPNTMLKLPQRRLPITCFLSNLMDCVYLVSNLTSSHHLKRWSLALLPRWTTASICNLFSFQPLIFPVSWSFIFNAFCFSLQIMPQKSLLFSLFQLSSIC